MEKVEVSVMAYYAYTWYYPFMPREMFEVLEKAFLEDRKTVLVNRKDYEQLLQDYGRHISN
jgi:hypothetical protein